MAFSPYLLKDEAITSKHNPHFPAKQKTTLEREIIYCYFINNVAYNCFK